MKTIKKTILLLTTPERYRGALLLLLIIFMALFETAGVASILPFLAVLGDPSVIDTNGFLSYLFKTFEFEDKQAFLYMLGTTAFAFLILSTIIRIVTTYATNRFVQMRRHSIGNRLLEMYLRQPYAFFFNHHTNDLSKKILSEVDLVVGGVLVPMSYMISGIITALALTFLLILIDPWVSFWAGVVIGGTYLIVFFVVKRMLSRIGEERTIANKERFTTAGEAMSGIKDIKLLGREEAYLSRFRSSSVRFARHQATAYTLALVPKYLIEAIGFGGILVLVLFLMATSDGIGTVLPILGVYAIAGYKLLPAAQKIYEGAAQLKYGTASVNELYEDLRQKNLFMENNRLPNEMWIPKEEISLDGLGFKYPNTSAHALSDISLTIPVGATIGLVGGTGAGKTTLVDIILALLHPSSGDLCIDGQVVTESNRGAWQNSLGYVPQDIFLTDASIAENIALGVPMGQINMELVDECARMAQVRDFIISELPEKYDTVVGERGVRMSGGQRQRIGIARALYNKPTTLVLDEATSALDNITERAVMDAVNSIGNNRTIIIIAHRLSTVRNCDKIFLLEKGRIKASGSFDDLQKYDKYFASLSENA